MAPGIRKRALSILRGRSVSVSSQDNRQHQQHQSEGKVDDPPPYGSNPASASTDYASGNDVEESVDKTTVTENHVQICPHEKLSFSRLQAIKSLPGFKDSFEGVPALTEGFNSLHKVTGWGSLNWKDKCSCVIKAGNSNYLVSTEVSLRNVQVGEDYWGYMKPDYTGVQLRTEWFFWLDYFPEELTSPESLVQLFKKKQYLHLCEHHLLIDWVTPELLARSLKFGGQRMDPTIVDRVEETFDGQGECESCHTVFSRRFHITKNHFYVTSKRFLGKAKSAKDPIWLS
ncbi:MAG: hypothetical protein Q9201_006196, partial [Fulgogasparrea decipioides]